MVLPLSLNQPGCSESSLGLGAPRQESKEEGEAGTKRRRRRRERRQRAEARSYLFQCSLLLYRAGNMRGITLDTLSLIRLKMYSLFQKYSARSATCGDENKTDTTA